MSADTWQVSNEVSTALRDGRPVVALESTIITHGLPRPRNLEVAEAVEQAVRDEGAVPATIALLRGRVHIGLTGPELRGLALDDHAVKASVRDLGILLHRGISGSTTVAATAHLAVRWGLRVFATGGIGGVHRGAHETYDESADLVTLGRSPLTVVSAGIKSILDIPATLERLETFGVGMVGYRTDAVPGFYLTDSGYPVPFRVESPEEVAGLMHLRDAIGDRAALLVFQGLPEDLQMSPEGHDALLRQALAAAESQGVGGKDATPFLLRYFHENSEGSSLDANTAIIVRNARLAARIATAFTTGIDPSRPEADGPVPA